MHVMTRIDESRLGLGTEQLAFEDLRRQLIRRASILSVRARSMRGRGDTVGANRVEAEAERLFAGARDMRPDA
jgi:hypothetical protein